MSEPSPGPEASALIGVIQNYAWGSRTALAELTGAEPSAEPQAELWLGAHERGPGQLGDGTRLDEAIKADPEGALGPTVVENFGGGLPFLLKVLAAGEPLSIQAHPSRAEAMAGFDREDAAGVAIDAPDRSFRDRNHKPELICALSEFVALCGFRELSATRSLIEGLKLPKLAALLFGNDEAGDVDNTDGSDRALLARALRRALSLDTDTAGELVAAVGEACARDLGPEEFAAERQEVANLAASNPGDRGVIVALLLHLVVLAPNQALFLGAGNLHAYLRGTGVEIMANSDNVLRGGLTPKHIDIPTLLDVVDTTPYDLQAGVQSPNLSKALVHYRCPVPDFNLTRVAPTSDGPLVVAGRRPQILLCTEGYLQLSTEADDGAGPANSSINVEQGGAVWIPASVAKVGLAGNGVGFLASVDPQDL